MIKQLPAILLPAFLLLYVVLNVEPPASFTSASPLQLAYFFLPALLLLSALANLYFDYWPKSFTFGATITFLFIFKALDVFNVVTFFITAAAAILIIRSFKKPKNNFLKQGQIPTLSRLKKQ